MTLPARFLSWLLLYGAALTFSLIAEPAAPFTVWLVINFGAFLGWVWIGLAFHEAVHALAGRTAGLSVRRVGVGVGPLLLRARPGGVDLDLRLVPEGGEVAFSARAASGLKGRLAAAYLAPIGAHALVIAAVYAALGAEGFDEALSRPWHSANALVAGLVLVQGAFALNAVPFEVKGRGGAATTTDALRAMRLSGMGRDEALRLVALHRYDECRALIAAERGDDAAAVARGLLEENRLPELVVAVKWMFGTALITAGRYAEARAVLLDSLGPPRPSGVGTALALSNAAWATLMTGDPALLDEADALSREACARGVEDPTIAATRGTVLLRLGRTRDAVPLLAQAWEAVSSRRARAYRAAALAVAAARAGLDREARARLDDARAAWPECDLLPWAATEVGRPAG